MWSQVEVNCITNGKVAGVCPDVGPGAALPSSCYLFDLFRCHLEIQLKEIVQVLMPGCLKYLTILSIYSDRRSGHCSLFKERPATEQPQKQGHTMLQMRPLKPCSGGNFKTTT